MASKNGDFLLPEWTTIKVDWKDVKITSDMCMEIEWKTKERIERIRNNPSAFPEWITIWVQIMGHSTRILIEKLLTEN